MKILFIVPPSSLKERWGKFSSAVQTYLPLGLAYVAAVTEEEGYNVRVIDAVAMKYGFKDIEETIKKFSPDVIGQQTVFSNLESCHTVAKIAKSINPNVKVILGGAHVTMYPEETIKQKEIDFIIFGEGEKVIRDLLNSIKSRSEFSKVLGIIWKDGDRIVKNKPQSYIDNLDVLPFPARHLFPINKYQTTSQLKGKRTLSMIASRGCPFRCAYCWVPSSFGKILRYRSPIRVIEEIIILKEKYGADSIRFWDDSFTVNRRWINEFCDLLITKKLSIAWSCLTRVNLVEREILEKMREAGCYQIYYGIESGVQRILDLIGKDISIEQARRALKLTKKAGIESFCSYMLALPGETVNDAEQTINFAIELDSDYVQFNLTIPHISGHKFCNLAVKHGTVLQDEICHATLFDNPAYIPFGRTREELKESVKRAYKRFYLRPSYIFRRLYKLRGLSPRKYFILIWTGIKVLFWR